MQVVMLILVLALATAAPVHQAEAVFAEQTEQTEISDATLEAARERLSANRDTLGLTSIATRVSQNAIAVGAPAWDETGKRAVIEVAGISNIIFEIYDGTARDD